jgi:hypothetical protein
LHYSDFIPLGENLYSTNLLTATPKTAVSILLFIIPASLIGFTGFRYWKKRKKSIAKTTWEENNRTPNNLPSPASTLQVFEEIEIQLLQLLINKSATGNTTSIDELNNILGLTKKPVEIQKKQRSDIIISTNKKYSFITQTEVPLIQKRRTEADKRSYEYFIDYNQLEVISRLLKKEL